MRPSGRPTTRIGAPTRARRRNTSAPGASVSEPIRFATTAGPPRRRAAAAVPAESLATGAGPPAGWADCAGGYSGRAAISTTVTVPPSSSSTPVTVTSVPANSSTSSWLAIR